MNCLLLWIELKLKSCTSHAMFDSLISTADLGLIQPHVAHMISFIEHIALDEDHSDSNIAACCGLIGYILLININFLSVGVQTILLKR